MLGKLLKYNLKGIMKFLSVFYIITFFISVLTRLFINEESPFIVFLTGRILSGVLISLFASILINCIMRLWLKTFVRGIYGDESYLTHTLPVKKSDIYLSNLFTAVIAALSSIAVIVTTAFIAYYTEERWQIVKQMFLAEKTAVITVFILITIFLEFANLIQCGYTGIILGHKLETGKTAFSVLFAFLVQTATQAVVFIFTAIAALFSMDFKMLFTGNDTEIPTSVLLATVIVYVLIITVNAIINVKILNTGVNVE
ncbi:MAG: hypothetical protein J5659_02270 [Clostridia bacterium]|nr:hypothetical protein [Clostridia bacterium]